MSGGTIQITDDEVVLLFAGQQGKFFGNPAEKSVQTHFYTGHDGYNGAFNTNVTKSTALSDQVTTPSQIIQVTLFSTTSTLSATTVRLNLPSLPSSQQRL